MANEPENRKSTTGKKTVRKSPAKSGNKPKSPPKTSSSPAASAGTRTPHLRMQPHSLGASNVGTTSDHLAYEYLGEVSGSYGSKKLFLIARDPQWLFAYWDLTDEQYTEAEAAAHDHKVLLQIYNEQTDERTQQIQIHRGASDWYVNVNQPDTTFYAEIGYYQFDGDFQAITRSAPASTPREGFSWRTHTDFATIPFHFSFEQLKDLIAEHMKPGEDLATAVARLQIEGFPFPFQTFLGGALSDNAHDSLLDYLQGDYNEKLREGSEEIAEAVKTRIEDMRSSGQWPSSEWMSSWAGGASEQLGGASGQLGGASGQLGGISSEEWTEALRQSLVSSGQQWAGYFGLPTSWGGASGQMFGLGGASGETFTFGGASGELGGASGQLGGASGMMGASENMGGESQAGRDFFMHVNAELIIYGGTHPDATVKVGGQQIQLRPDGTFSYHFSFRDGHYHIPISAQSPDKVETRHAMLSFLRMSEYSGGVDATPQPPLPTPDDLSSPQP